MLDSNKRTNFNKKYHFKTFFYVSYDMDDFTILYDSYDMHTILYDSWALMIRRYDTKLFIYDTIRIAYCTICITYRTILTNMGQRIFYHSIPKNILKQTWEIKSKEYRRWFDMIYYEIINEQKFIVVYTTDREGYCTYTFILVQTTNVKTQNWRLCII